MYAVVRTTGTKSWTKATETYENDSLSEISTAVAAFLGISHSRIRNQKAYSGPQTVSEDA
jgi:hypothetical protein